MVDIRTGFEESGEVFVGDIDGAECHAVDVAEFICERAKWPALLSLASCKVVEFFYDRTADKIADVLPWCLAAARAFLNVQ